MTRAPRRSIRELYAEPEAPRDVPVVGHCRTCRAPIVQTGMYGPHTAICEKTCSCPAIKPAPQTAHESDAIPPGVAAARG
jgi:hypothetical protein